jgi:hypothetical protein
MLVKRYETHHKPSHPVSLANYYGMKDQKAKASDADQRRSVKVPLVFWYAQGLPMVLNHNRYTHCGWTNGSTGRASNIVLDPREPPDDGEGDFRELHTRCVVTLAGGTVR